MALKMSLTAVICCRQESFITILQKSMYIQSKTGWHLDAHDSGNGRKLGWCTVTDKNNYFLFSQDGCLI